MTEGGSGLLKPRRARFGTKRGQHRGAIHPSRHRQRHGAKPARNDAQRPRFAAWEHTSDPAAKQRLRAREAGVRPTQAAAAASRMEAVEELRTLHRRKVLARLRKPRRSPPRSRVCARGSGTASEPSTASEGAPGSSGGGGRRGCPASSGSGA